MDEEHKGMTTTNRQDQTAGSIHGGSYDDRPHVPTGTQDLRPSREPSKELTMGHMGTALFNDAMRSFTRINGVGYHNLLTIDPDRADRKITVIASTPEDLVLMTFDVEVTVDRRPLYRWKISDGRRRPLADSGRLVMIPSYDDVTLDAMHDFHDALEQSDGYVDQTSLVPPCAESPWIVPDPGPIGLSPQGIPMFLI